MTGAQTGRFQVRGSAARPGSEGQGGMGCVCVRGQGQPRNIQKVEFRSWPVTPKSARGATGLGVAWEVFWGWHLKG